MKKRIFAVIFLLTLTVGFISCTDETEKFIDETNQKNFVDPKKVKPPTNG